MSNKPNIKLIVVIILSIFAVFSLIRGVVISTKFGRRVVLDTSEGNVNLAEDSLSLKRKAKRSNYSSVGRNPFIVGAASINVNKSILEGIIWDEKFPLVLINGKTLKIGDKLGAETVVDIQKNKVILSDGITNRELKIQ